MKYKKSVLNIISRYSQIFNKKNSVKSTIGKQRTINLKLSFNSPVRKPFIMVINRKQLTVSATLFAVFIALCIVIPITGKYFLPEKSGQGEGKDVSSYTEDDTTNADDNAANTGDQATQDNIDIAVIKTLDLSDIRMDIKTDMLRINEPTLWGNQLIYSAGNSLTIDDPVLTKLYLYDINTNQETEIVSTEVKYGEIYEGRINDQWIVWLDTNQVGLNYIYAMERKTGEISMIKKCSLNKPQLRLFGDNLAWVEQNDANQDRLYLYNFKSGEPISLDNFQNVTYGICPPAIYNNTIVWVYPDLDGSDNKSIIKKMDLTSLNLSNTVGNGDLVEGDDVESEEEEYGTIDPKGFAMYPATNGEVVAWMDDLDPIQANLKMTIDGENIVTIAKGVGRFFGVGDNFVTYTQQGRVMLYFWETKNYGTLTKLGEEGRLSNIPAVGNKVVWYDASDSSLTQDTIYVSTIPTTSELE